MSHSMAKYIYIYTWPNTYIYIYIYIYIVLGKTLWTLQTAKGFMIKHLKVLRRPSFLSPHAVIPQSSEHLSNASPGLRSVSEAML